MELKQVVILCPRFSKQMFCQDICFWQRLKVVKVIDIRGTENQIMYRLSSRLYLACLKGLTTPDKAALCSDIFSFYHVDLPSQRPLGMAILGKLAQSCMYMYHVQI